MYPADDLRQGRLTHLGIELTEIGLNTPVAVIPLAESGKYSSRNISGYEVVRKDLPLETHYNTIESPNWGDSYNGTHSVDLPYKKYPRDVYGPQFTAIKISSPNTGLEQSDFMVVFEVDRVLNKKDPMFEEGLLECLNLLQENVGSCGIELSGATFADYKKSMVVDWEMLPPGTREEAIQRLYRHRQPTPVEKATVEERYDFLMELNPEQLVYGMSGIQRYFGALINENLIVFENIAYGNAIYVMFENWQELSKRSRTELLSGRYGKNFERIPHAGGWKTKVNAVVRKSRK